MQDATALALEKNRDREVADEVDWWDCLHLVDYQKIVTNSHDAWESTFATKYTRPSERKKGGSWKDRTAWLSELNRIRNQNAHEYVVAETEYNFLRSLTSWLLDDEQGGNS